jgi:alpha-N-arabinofuranosidase
MERRSILKAVAGAAATAFTVSHRALAADAEIELAPQAAGVEISPHIYGHFIEHLGGVIYDGIWVGRNSKIANLGGLRARFVEDMRQLGAPNLRWPGGCFADGYHWRDGIGPAARRPRTATYWGRQLPPALKGAEPNWFGTHEFMRLCRLTGAVPYLAANLASGSPQEFYDWISYCNAPAGSVSLADQRAANGDADPFNVQFWGIGNEVWGCGGNINPADYMSMYRLFSSQMPPYGQPYLVACGPRGHSPGSDVAWTSALFESVQGGRGRARISGLSMHFYTDFRPTTVSSAESTPEQWYAVLKEGLRIETAILDNWAVMAKYDPTHRIKFVVDEWGVWYSRSPEIAPGFNLAQVVTLRDAVHTAMHFDIFNRHADKVFMANVAQTINCLHSLFLAFEDKYVRTPVYHVFEMYKPHMGARMVPLTIQAAELKVAVLNGQATLPGLSASASIREKLMTVTLSNPSAEAGATARLRIAGSGRPVEARGAVLAHAAMNAANTFEKPDEVKPAPISVTVSGDSVTVLLPKQSVAALQLRLA